jgi:hypothetical protein
MPRFVPAKSLFPIALSASALARALQINKTKVLRAVRDGEVDCYSLGTAKRILVADAIEWIKTTWKRN